jgi:hypothetical protein
MVAVPTAGARFLSRAWPAAWIPETTSINKTRTPFI